jgi:hypothetical protein
MQRNVGDTPIVVSAFLASAFSGLDGFHKSAIYDLGTHTLVGRRHTHRSGQKMGSNVYGKNV